MQIDLEFCEKRINEQNEYLIKIYTRFKNGSLKEDLYLENKESALKIKDYFIKKKEDLSKN
jgi:hypothetical protein